MSEPGRRPAPGRAAQDAVTAYFGDTAGYWLDIYRQDGLQGLVYRLRMETALGWIDELGPASGAAALELGSGAGLLSVSLAARGLRVTATDASAEMVALTAESARRAGAATIATAVADAHSLAYPDGAFALVVALGVLPWLHDPTGAVAEMARVLAPGGLLVVSADNRLRLNSLIDQSPLLVPARLAWRLARRGDHPPPVRAALHTPRAVDAMLVAAGLEPVRGATLGFGPFTLRHRAVLDEALSLRIHLRLQRWTDRGRPGVRRMGWHYLAAARRRA